MVLSVATMVAEAQGRAKSRPSDPEARFALFRAYAIQGAWERARTQLEVAATLHGGMLPTRLLYSTAIAAERVRAEVFAGSRPPEVMGEPGDWVALLVQALRPGADRVGLHHRAADVFPDTRARDGERVLAALADADPRLGPVFELFIDGRYYWVPFDRVSTITWDAPSDALDLVWMPCSVVLRDGGATLSCLMPVRYPGTLESGDDELLLGHATDWRDRDEEQEGLGHRMFWSEAGCFQMAASRGFEFLSTE